MFDSKLTPLYIFPSGMGDAVMALAVARNYYAHTGKIFHIGHNCVDIFTGCKYIVCHSKYAFWSLTAESQQQAESEGYCLVSLFYFSYRQVCSDYWINYSIHKNLVSLFCSQVGLNGEIELQPILELTEEEKKVGEFAKGKIAVISTGVASYKTWSLVKLQEVIDSFPEQKFIQLGMYTDPLLNNVEDCRGRFTLRQVAGILFHSRLFFGPVGGMMHLARSVNCPALILLPSFESAPWYYSGFDYLVSASRCTKCDDLKLNPEACIQRKLCINISTEQAILALKDILKQERKRLQPETMQIEAIPVSGLDLYRKMVSCLPYKIKLVCSSSHVKTLGVFDFCPDEDVFDFPIYIDSVDCRTVMITVDQNSKWLFEVCEVYWESSSKAEKSILKVVSASFLKIKIGGTHYLSSFARQGRFTVYLPDSIKEKGTLRLALRFLTLEHGVPTQAPILSKACWFRIKAKILYNIVRLWTAIHEDSLLRVAIRCKEALSRNFKYK